MAKTLLILIKKFKLSISLITIIIIGILSVFIIFKYSWKGDDGNAYKGIIRSDGMGYYMYLPNIFLNKSLNHQTPENRYIIDYNHRGVNKYYAGTAIAMLPFFGVGYITAYINDNKLDGYSPAFQKAISLAGLFYLLLGLLFLRLFLKLYQIKDTTIAIVLLLFLFGTNLLNYALLDPSMSHIYSFCFISIFLFLIKKYFVCKRNILFFLSVIVIGLIVLIRPINFLIILIIPFLTNSKSNLKNEFFKNWNTRSVIFGTILFIIIISIQPILWYLQTGNFFIWSYQNEGFNFLHPQFINVLFSFKKGLFIYTPIIFLSLFGLYSIAKKSKYEFLSILLFLLFLIYITSCWWNWYYGASFGQRAFIDFYGIFGLLLAIFFDYIRLKFLKTIIYSISLILLSLNLIQSYQYYNHIISPDNMDLNKYKYVFLKVTSNYINCLGGNNDILPYNCSKEITFRIINNFENEVNNCTTHSTIIDSSSKSKVCDYSNNEFNTLINIPLDNRYITRRGLFAEVRLEIFDLSPLASKNALFVIDISDSLGNNYYYYRFPINEISYERYGKWNSCSYSIEIPCIKSIKDRLNIYIWNIEKKSFYIDNLDIKVYVIK